MEFLLCINKYVHAYKKLYFCVKNGKVTCTIFSQLGRLTEVFHAVGLLQLELPFGAYFNICCKRTVDMVDQVVSITLYSSMPYI